MPTRIPGRAIRLKNRRVFLALTEEGWLMQFTRLGNQQKGEKRAHITELRLSREAMAALVDLYQNQTNHFPTSVGA